MNHDEEELEELLDEIEESNITENNDQPLNQPLSNNIVKNGLTNKNDLSSNIKERIANSRNKIRFGLGNRLSTISNVTNKLKSSKETEELNNEEAKKTANIGLATADKLKKVRQLKASPELKKEATNVLLKKLLASKYGAIAIAVCVGIIVLIMLVSVILTNVKDDESEVNTSNEVTNLIKDAATFDDITAYLVDLGICLDLDDDEEEKKACEESDYGQFLLYFKDVYKEYQKYSDKNGNPIELDIPLLMETISYNRTDDAFRAELKYGNENVLNGTFSKNPIYEELDDLAEAMVEKVTEYGDLYKKVGTTCKTTEDKEYKTYYRISDDKYISYLKYGEVHENYSGESKLIDIGVHPDSDAECIPEGETYIPPEEERYESINTNLKLEQITIPIEGLSKSYKIAWVSDLHLIAQEDVNSSTKAFERYNNVNEFFKTGTHSDEWLVQIVEFLNSGNFDGVIFGGDILDQGTAAGISLFKEYYDKINVPNKMYVRADHDYLTDLWNGTSGNQDSITSTKDIYSFSIENVVFVGINYSNKDFDSSVYNELKQKIEGSSNVIIATHVPYESKTESQSLKDASLLFKNQVYYWQNANSGDRFYYSSGENSNMYNYLNNYIYKNSSVRYVLAGHMHGGWNGTISSTGLKQKIFTPAYEGSVGVITLQPK